MRKLFSLFAAMLVALTASAKVWTVGPNHNEESDRTDCNLYVTLDRLAQAGDTILLADGEYIETLSMYVKGAAVIMAEEGAKPVIKQSSYFKLKADAKFIGIKFEHVAESNGYCMYFQPGCSRLELQDCEITGFKETCIMSWDEYACNNLIINNCYIHDNVKCVIYDPSGYIANTVITNSTIVNNDCSPWSAAPIDIRKGSSTDHTLLVDHCTFYNNKVSSDSYADIRPRGLNGVKVKNCIFAHPEAYAARATRFVNDDTVEGCEVINCLTFNYTKNTDRFGHYTGSTLTGCAAGNPLFVNAAEGNFNLDEGSPALTMNDGAPIGDPRWWPAPAEPQTLYLKPGVWNAAGARFALYTMDDMQWYDMTAVEGEFGFCYKAEIPASITQVIFCRMNGATTDNNWDNKWNQTQDMTIEESKDLCTISDWAVGAWGVFTATPWVDGSSNKMKVFKNGTVPGVVNIQKPGWADESGIYMTFPSAAWDKTKFSLPAGTYATEGAGMVIYLSALDMKFNEISINCNNTDYAFTVYNADGADVVYNVAGEPETVFGSTWNTYANKMTLDEGLYKLEKTGLELAAGTIAFKVVKNHNWDAGAWPTDNYVLNVAESGIYTISITFNESTKEINATATKTGEAVVLPVVTLHGNFSGEWAGSDAFAEATDKKTSSLTMTLAKGNYEFGMKFGGVWTANGVAFTRTNPSAAVTAGTGNLTLAADVAGDYTFTWTYETNTLSIAYPVKYYEYATGHLNNPDFGDASGRILLTLSKSGNDIVVTIKNNNAKGNPQTGLNFLQVSAVGATTVTYGSHETENTETVSVKVKFDAPKDSYTFNSIHWAYAGFGGEWAIDGLTVPASQICELEDGYYLVGTFGGVEAWDLDDLSAEKRFEANPSTDGEYMLTATLAENDNLKVVKVINDAYGPWYPATDPNYVVGANYVGMKTIYFRPNGDGGEGWHYGYIYIAPNTPTAIDNATIAEKAKKFIENGQLFIELNGVRYNALGQTVK